MDLAALARDPEWLAHRYDPGHDAVHFRRVPRADHARIAFLTDELLPGDKTPIVLRRADAIAAQDQPAAPMHFIFHSAYCCSTLMVRALDIPGTAMGLSEPVILNDLVGWRHRGATPAQLDAVLPDTLTLLARPFARGEAMIVKPSNVVNGFAAAMLAARPNARALLMYAPLRAFLGSVARKQMWGRLWVRDLLVKQLRDDLVHLGFTDEDYLGLTDLQAAAVGWLAQHALFAKLGTRFGGRVRALDSEVLVARPADTLARATKLFGLALDTKAAERIASGLVFARDAKTGEAFAPGQRRADQRAAEELHADEIDKVAIWADAVARNAGVALAAAHL